MSAELALSREIVLLGVLARWEGFPICTAEIRANVHPSITGPWVLPTLHRLAGQGRIQRLHPPGSRTYYWRR